MKREDFKPEDFMGLPTVMSPAGPIPVSEPFTRTLVCVSNKGHAYSVTMSSGDAYKLLEMFRQRDARLMQTLVDIDVVSIHLHLSDFDGHVPLLGAIKR